MLFVRVDDLVKGGAKRRRLRRSRPLTRSSTRTETLSMRSRPLSRRSCKDQSRTAGNRQQLSGDDGVFVRDIRRERCASVGRMGQIGPLQGLVIKTLADGRLDHVEIGRDVEVARAVQRGVADFQNLLQRLQTTR